VKKPINLATPNFDTQKGRIRSILQVYGSKYASEHRIPALSQPDLPALLERHPDGVHLIGGGIDDFAVERTQPYNSLSLVAMVAPCLLWSIAST
jgi:hypothetical protein